MKKKYLMFIGILALAIGFASVSTVLYLNGSAKILGNTEDFESGVIFTDASVKNDKGTATISEDGKTITFATSTLSKLNETSVLDFTIFNGSSQYDADVTISCVVNDESNAANENVTFAADAALYEIPSKTDKDGSVTVTVVKNVTEQATVEFTCTLNATANERDTAGKLEVDATEVYYTNADNEQVTIADALNDLYDKLS